MMRSSHSRSRSIGAALGLVVLLAGCGMSWEARGAFEMGLHNRDQKAFREALTNFRDAARLSPDSVEVQLALGEAAEILGEFDQALSAYQAAARRSPSTKTWVRVGRMADRMGNVNLAVQALEAGYGTWRQHAWEATKLGTATCGFCTSSIWPAVWMMWTHCIPAASKNGGHAFDASRERVPQEVFSILVEAGPRERALAFARGRGWLRSEEHTSELQSRE